MTDLFTQECLLCCKSLYVGKRGRYFSKGANETPDINEWWNMEKERGCEQERRTGMKVNEKKRWRGSLA